MLSLAWPWVLALSPLPWLLRWLRPGGRPTGALRLPQIGPLPAAGGALRPGGWRGPLLALAWLALVLALARPQYLGEAQALPVTGRDLLLAVDISGSMENNDFFWNGQRLTRLDAVRAVAGDFIARRGGDRVGLILFGARAYVQTPLTFDTQTVAYFLRDAAVGLAGKSTAIGDAIGLAIKRLRDRPAASRVVILLTDGDNTAGELSPQRAAEVAAAQGVRIHTIGVGREERGFFGAAVPGTGVDEASLRAVAASTGGEFFKAADTAELIAVYRALDALEPAAAGDQIFRPAQALSHWPLAAALLLLWVACLPWSAGVVRG